MGYPNTQIPSTDKKNKVPAIQTETEKESTTLFICFARFSGDPDFLLRTDVWDHHCF